MSQSSLSKHIKSIETELGCQLFDRTTRTVRLTDIGKEILAQCEAINGLYNEILDKTAFYQKQMRNHFNLLSIPVMAQYKITKCIHDFLKIHREITISFAEAESQKIDSVIRNKEAEIAFVRYVNRIDDDFECVPYCQDVLVAVVPTGHPLARRKEIELIELKQDSFILLDAQTKLYDILIQILETAGVQPRVQQTFHRIENIVDLVGQNAGVSLLFRRQYDYVNKTGTTAIPLKNAPISTIGLIKLKHHRLSYGARIFWDYVSNNYGADILAK